MPAKRHILWPLTVGVSMFALLNHTQEPTPIRMQPLTPAILDAEYTAERKQIQYARAERTAARVLRIGGCTDEHASIIARSAVDQGLDVRILSALIVTESSCRAEVVSSKGAVGLMQVKPDVWDLDAEDLKDPEFNINAGTQILKHYTRSYGRVGGLRHYNGTGVGCDTCDSVYPDKILALAGVK